jgi:hypothetical protein
MSILIVTLSAVGAFLAGFLLRGMLAVALERKRRRHPLSGLSDQQLRGFVQIADGRWGQPASFRARQEIKNEVLRRNLPFDHQAGQPAGPSVFERDEPLIRPPAGPRPRQRGEQGW